MSDQKETPIATDSTSMLHELFKHGQISVTRGEIYDRVPEPVRFDELRTHQRIEGLIVGLSVGDALGHSTEWQFDPERRNREFGTIVDHVGSFVSQAGRISDDTQLSLWTLERLLTSGRLNLHELTKCFVSRRDKIVGMGRNTSAALLRHRERLQSGFPAYHECAGNSQSEGRGNGALMRFAPLLLPHLRTPSPDMWADVTMAALMTHGHVAALSSVVAFAHLLWEIFRRPTGDAPNPEWWLDEYVRVACDLEKVPLPFPLNTDPIPTWFKDFRGTLWQFVDTRVRAAWRRGVSVRVACSLEGFGSRADCVQTVPALLYVLMSHADSLESAIISAVNDTKDNDTIGSIVGGIVGALHGRSAIRKRWMTGISSRSLTVDAGLFTEADRDVIEQFANEAAERFG